MLKPGLKHQYIPELWPSIRAVAKMILPEPPHLPYIDDTPRHELCGCELVLRPIT
jgi:hypothetical protein